MASCYFYLLLNILYGITTMYLHLLLAFKELTTMYIKKFKFALNYKQLKEYFEITNNVYLHLESFENMV